MNIFLLSENRNNQLERHLLANSMVNLRDQYNLVDNDYEIALLLDKEERDNFRKVKSENFESI